MSVAFDQWAQWPVYGLSQEVKSARLAHELHRLTKHHAEGCLPYRRILDGFGYDLESFPAGIESIPFVPVQLFKHSALRTGAPEATVRELNSSGTTGHSPSRIFLDQETSIRQSKALVKILQQFIGSQRLPMLIIDAPPQRAHTHAIQAREAAVRGMRLFARETLYACATNATDSCTESITEFHSKYSGSEILIFGNTVSVWQFFLNASGTANQSFDFSNATLLHTGGWKKLQNLAVPKSEFKKRAWERFSISRVHDYYGMAEQVGSVFVECEHGFLHCPSFADVIIRNSADWRVQGMGQRGIIQTLSLLPLSYPGHSLLTEDYGIIQGIDDCQCGRLGKYFVVEGRVPNSESRGCAN